MSLPSRERGLKSQVANQRHGFTPVAPLAGAWIEIASISFVPMYLFVAPLAGAWIEIYVPLDGQAHASVAPLAGAWIEISSTRKVCFR